MIYSVFLSLFLSLWGALSPVSAQAQERPQFLFPLSCKLGEDCWGVNYVDMDPAAGEAVDFNCSHRTYDGHKGTDFALRSLREMNHGVDVLAAADGKVLRFRDGQSDAPKKREELEALSAANKDCGNGIILDHGNGVFTQYCHLKQGSLSVRTGQSVKEGQKIAQIGHSGMAEFPHLHFQIMWEGAIMDPFTGLKNTDGCKAPRQKPLWHVRSPVSYEAGALFDAGFSAAQPDFSALQRGEQAPDIISKDAQALVFWVALYGVQKDDKVDLIITGPEGRTFLARSFTQDSDRARQYYYTGRSLSGKNLTSGLYKGEAYLKRPGQADRHIQRKIIVR